jgi:NAD(P)H-binding
MKLTVFGATGGVGRQVVTQALDAGHHVTAYVRNPAKARPHPPQPQAARIASRIVRVPSTSGMAAALRSSDGPRALITASALATARWTVSRSLSSPVTTVDVGRYIGMATPSLRDPRDTKSLLGWLVPVMGRRGLPRAYRELLDMSQLVIDSELDWTIARFMRPTDGERTGTVRAGYLGRDKIRLSITRADIAAFLLDQTTDSRFQRAAPAISN